MRFAPYKRHLQLSFYAGSFSFLVLAAGCGKPFNVKSRVSLPFEGSVTRYESVQVAIEASPIRDEDLLYDTFDANLILAGLLPVNVKVTNRGQSHLHLENAKFGLRDSRGRDYKYLDGKSAFKRLISFHEISTYNKHGYKRSMEDFTAYDLQRKPLGPGESRTGLVFFAVDPPVAREALTMTLHGKLTPTNETIEIALP